MSKNNDHYFRPVPIRKIMSSQFNASFWSLFQCEDHLYSATVFFKVILDFHKYLTSSWVDLVLTEQKLSWCKLFRLYRF